MKKAGLIVGLLVLVSACYKGQSVDLIIHNAKIHTIDEAENISQAIAIRDGKIIEVGPERQIQNKYATKEIIDAKGKDIYPGFTDAHGHILMLAELKLSADLIGSRSMSEMLVRLEKYASRTGRKFVVGRGWDQSLWGEQTLPSNEKLNEIFPNIPVVLFRIDAHAMLVNDRALQLAGIQPSEKIDGGEIVVKDGKCTGILIDKAMDKVLALIPEFSDAEKMTAIEEIQDELFQYGVTNVHEAGINYKDIALFKKMVSENKLKLNLYAMLFPTPENFKFAEENGIYNFKNLSIRSFKVIGDGSLGSRGACMKHDYTDAPGHLGFLTTPLLEINRIATFCRKVNYQMNTHAIGDSTNRLILDVLENVNKTHVGHRWRIEHAQVLDAKDILRVQNSGAFPSVQPLHAVSDQRWVKDRIGEQRMQTAYAYQSLLTQAGMVAIGTDFPVESFNPFYTIHAAVQRKNSEGVPGGGFEIKEAITFLDCIKGMTIWAAYAAFDENRLGSIEAGKEATFVILESSLKSKPDFRENFAYMTFVKGKKVYSGE